MITRLAIVVFISTFSLIDYPETIHLIAGELIAYALSIPDALPPDVVARCVLVLAAEFAFDVALTFASLSVVDAVLRRRRLSSAGSTGIPG